MNSFVLLIIFLCFIAFGYLSLGRVVHKIHHARMAGSGQADKRQIGLNIIKQLGVSTVFYSLPAISIALFWGWVSALLWFFSAHLMAEMMINYQLALSPVTSSEFEHNTHRGNALTVIRNAYLILLIGIVTTWMTQLIDTHSGTLFFLAFLIPAQTVYQNGTSSLKSLRRISSQLLALAILSLGLLFSYRLGIVFHGNWSPFANILPWLLFNNETLVALLIIILGWNQSHDRNFRVNMGCFAGVLMLLLLALMLTKLAILRPLLDAPLHNNIASENAPPLFIGICLLLFSSSIGAYLRVVLAPSNASNKQQALTANQVSSLLVLVFLIALLCTLAAAMGTGAWSTHYLQWPTNINLSDHFRLATRSLLSLLSGDPQSTSLLGIGIISSICVLGLSLVLYALYQLTHQSEPKTKQNSSAHYLKLTSLVLLTLFLLWYGITLNIWLIFGILNWLLVSHFHCQSRIDTPPWEHRSKLFLSFTLLLVTTGAIQTLILTIYWAINHQTIWALISLILLCLSLYLLYRPCTRLARALFRKPETLNLQTAPKHKKTG